MILLVEKWVMSLVGLNMNVALVGICLALKESGLGATPPWGRGGVEGCCTTAPVCAGEAENRDGEEEKDVTKRSSQVPYLPIHFLFALYLRTPNGAASRQ